MIPEKTRVHVVCTCRRCHLAWNPEYDVIEWTDTDGAPVRCFSQNGVRVPNPYGAGMCCPRCGGLRVDSRPSGTMDPPALHETTPLDDVRLPTGDSPFSRPRRPPYGPPYPAF